MSLTVSGSLQLIGAQEPRVLSAPLTPLTGGVEAVALAELVKLHLFPWERLVCDVVLRQHATGRYAVLEALLLVSRQNGKGTCIEAVELYALFIAGANVYHTAHLMETSRKAYKRLWRLIERTPSLRRRVLGKPNITAEQITITLVGGNFITFMARSGRRGRGFDDADLLVLDEALFLQPGMVEATLPAMSTRSSVTPTGPLVLYTSSAGVEGSALLRSLRDRVHNGDPMISGLDWSIDPELLKDPGFDPLATEVVRQANPSLGEGPKALIDMSYVRGEFAAMTSTGSRQGFYRERLGVFDEDPGEAAKVIPAAAWRNREDPERRRPGEPVGFGIGASWPDADWVSIGVSGWLGDELIVQVSDRRPGTGWVVDRVVELVGRWGNLGVALDPGGPAGPILEDLREAGREHGFEVLTPTIREIAQSSSRLRAAVVGSPATLDDPGTRPYLRHHGQEDLTAAARAATRRPLGNAWTFGIRDPDVDIGPLDAVNLAAWLAETRRPVEPSAPLGVPAATGGGPETADLMEIGF